MPASDGPRSGSGANAALPGCQRRDSDYADDALPANDRIIVVKREYRRCAHQSSITANIFFIFVLSFSLRYQFWLV